MKTQRYSAWSLPGPGQRRRDSGDDDEQRYRRKEPGSQKDCCCCSRSLVAGLLVGLLICTAGIVPAITVLLTHSGKTTSTSSTTAAIPVRLNVASTVSTTISTSTAATVSSSMVSTTVPSSSTSTPSTPMSSTTNVSTNSITTSITTTTTTTTVSTTTSKTTTLFTITTETTTTTTSTTTTAPYCTTRVTFDDIPGQSATSGVVPNGYNNLNWTNTQYLNASTVPISGYSTAVNSPPFVAYNPGGATITITTANGTRFAFNSIIIAAAWRDNLIWSIYGYSAGVNMVYASFTLTVINQTTISCGACSNWDTIYMTTSGGTPHSGFAQTGTEFGFDDLCISFGY